MSDYRVASSDDLTRLAARAKRAGFNRAPVLPPLDPDGVHVLDLLLYGHNMDSNMPLHHRTRVQVKQPGTDEPAEVMLDVADADWRRLHTAEAFRAALDAV